MVCTDLTKAEPFNVLLIYLSVLSSREYLNMGTFVFSDE